MPPEGVTRWWWIRHAPAAGVEGRFPTPDATLAPLIGSPRKLQALLPEAPIWVCSPLPRCRATLSWLAPDCNAALEPDFVEQSFGEWGGKSYNEVWAHSRDRDAWQHPETLRPPGGENFVETAERTRLAIARLTTQHAGADIAVVAHAGVIRAAMGMAGSMTLAQCLRLSIPHLSLTCLQHERGNWRIRRYPA